MRRNFGSRLASFGALRRAVVAAPAALVLAATVGAGWLVGSAGTAGAESVGVPQDGVFHLNGHGWGHGIGMSQWGAQGAALKGLSYVQILQHYYPGTAIRGNGDPTVRVRITADDSQLRVPAQAGLVVIDGSGRGMVLPAGYQQFRLLMVGGGLQLQGYTGAWTAIPLAGSTSMPAAARFENTATGIVRLYRPDSSSVGYRGAVFAVPSGASVVTLNHVHMEQYLRGVVPRESPASWAPEALGAQAVAARSYATREMTGHASDAYDICDTTACQVYGGAMSWSAANAPTTLEYPSTDSAVAGTAGQVLMYQGSVAFTQFSSSNGGYSTPGSQPYLVAAPDPYDGTAPGDPAHSWSAQVTAQEIQARYPAVGQLRQLSVTGRDGRGEWGGRVTAIALVGTSGSVTITGAQFMAIRSFPATNGLRSSWFAFAADPVPFGSYDGVTPGGNETARVFGWAIDPDSPEKLMIHVYVDGRFGGVLTAGDPRPDVAAIYPAAGPNHGFAGLIPTGQGTHTVCAYAINVGPGSGNSGLGCRTVTIPATNPLGFVDILGPTPGGIYVEGWALDPQTAAPIAVHVYVDGNLVTALTAAKRRDDIAAAFPGYGPDHGFATTVAASRGTHQVCVYGINVGEGNNNLIRCGTTSAG